ncbi:MAG: diguanylate cyclase [Phycisphaerae bacterium]|nr:diguanylate cyclase [Phycisphaerae bacterium]
MAGRAPGYVSRICVMASERGGQSVWCDRLTDAGWRVLPTEDVREAVAAIRAHMVDLVLVQLPFRGVANMDLPRVLREIAPLERVPVVILADEPGEAERANLLNGGADEVISQSTCPAEFVARINAQLRLKELHDEVAQSRQELAESLERERCLMTRMRRDRAELRELCTTDPLTRVQNVRSFCDILGHEFKMSIRYSQPLSLLMLDADHFKLVNDTYGHPTGDYVLKELAVILQRQVRQSDVVARTGGEEFGIILPKAGPKQAGKFAQRIRKEVAAHRFAVYGHHLRLTISIGWASYPADAEVAAAEMIVYLADQALLVAKETGRNRVVAFGQLDDGVRSRLVRQHNQPLLPAELPPAPAEVVMSEK